MSAFENKQGNATPGDSPPIRPAVQEQAGNIDELTVLNKEEATDIGVYTHTFKKPIPYNNITVEKLVFNWDSLTGQDSLDIENELLALGRGVVSPVFSGEYLIRMAARASTPKVGADFFARLSLSEYNKVRSAARSFLLLSE